MPGTASLVYGPRWPRGPPVGNITELLKSVTVLPGARGYGTEEDAGHRIRRLRPQVAVEARRG